MTFAAKHPSRKANGEIPAVLGDFHERGRLRESSCFKGDKAPSAGLGVSFMGLMLVLDVVSNILHKQVK